MLSIYFEFNTEFRKIGSRDISFNSMICKKIRAKIKKKYLEIELFKNLFIYINKNVISCITFYFKLYCESNYYETRF